MTYEQPKIALYSEIEVRHGNALMAAAEYELSKEPLCVFDKTIRDPDMREVAWQAFVERALETWPSVEMDVNRVTIRR